jgi:hypothetical protein
MASQTNGSANEKIALRNSWLKIFVVVVATGILAVKIWQANFDSILSGFNFSDLLALFLAMFSIALSVLFFLKATETSNVFYDNTYRFTKDVSEILGRVEAGFGERLRHLDEGYSGLKSAVERIPFDRVTAEKEIEEEEKQVREVEAERNQLIENLVQRASLEEEEKQKIFEQLRKQEVALSSARSELQDMQRRFQEAEIVTGSVDFSWPLVISSSLRNLIDHDIPPNLRKTLTESALNNRFKETLNDAPTSFISLLRRHQIIDKNNDLTSVGIEFLRRL